MEYPSGEVIIPTLLCSRALRSKNGNIVEDSRTMGCILMLRVFTHEVHSFVWFIHGYEKEWKGQGETTTTFSEWDYSNYDTINAVFKMTISYLDANMQIVLAVDRVKPANSFL